MSHFSPSLYLFLSFTSSLSLCPPLLSAPLCMHPQFLCSSPGCQCQVHTQTFCDGDTKPGSVYHQTVLAQLKFPQGQRQRCIYASSSRHCFWLYKALHETFQKWLYALPCGKCPGLFLFKSWQPDREKKNYKCLLILEVYKSKKSYQIDKISAIQQNSECLKAPHVKYPFAGIGPTLYCNWFAKSYVVKLRGKVCLNAYSV